MFLKYDNGIEGTRLARVCLVNLTNRSVNRVTMFAISKVSNAKHVQMVKKVVPKQRLEL